MAFISFFCYFNWDKTSATLLVFDLVPPSKKFGGREPPHPPACTTGGIEPHAPPDCFFFDLVCPIILHKYLPLL